MELVRKQINAYKMMTTEVLQFEEQTDLIIPDVNPDALSVITAAGNCCISEKQLRKERVTLSGDVMFTVMYRPENSSGCVQIGGKLPYSEILNLKEGKEEDLLFASVELMELRPVILNSRKIGIQCRLSMSACAYQRETVWLTQDVNALPEEGIQKRVTREQQTLLVAVSEKQLSFSEEIRMVSGEASPGDQLLRTELQWNTEDVKVLSKKIMLRGNVQVRAVLMAKEGNVRTSEYALPFSQIIESGEVRTDCQTEVNYSTVQMQSKLDVREDGTYLVCKLAGSAFLEVYQEQEICVVSDLYSTVYQTEVERCKTGTSGCCRKTLRAEFSDTQEAGFRVCQVRDYGCCGCAAQVSSGNIQGVFHVQALCEDEEGCLRQVCLTLRDERDGTEYCRGGAEVCVSAMAVSVTGAGALCFELHVLYRLRKPSACTCAQVEKCGINPDKKRSCRAPGTLLLRSVGEQETVWDLAKSYGTTEGAILSANHMNPEEALQQNQLVMIPFVRS